MPSEERRKQQPQQRCGFSDMNRKRGYFSAFGIGIKKSFIHGNDGIFDILTAIIRKMNELRRPNAAQPCKNQKSYHFAFVWGRLNAADEFFAEIITQLIYNASKHTETVKKSDCGFS